MRVLGDLVDAEALSHGVEVHVARADDRLVQVHPAVSALLPAMELVVTEMHAAAAEDALRRIDGVLLERGGGDDDLEGGPRRILSLDRLVRERMQRIGDQLTPLVLGDAAREEIGIEGRLRHHRQHAAVVGIHHDDGTLLIAHRLLGPDQLHEVRELGSHLVDLLSAVVTAEPFLPVFLEPVLSDRVAHLVARQALELVDADLTHVAERVRGDGSVQIIAPRADLHGHAGQLDLPRLDGDQRVPVDVAAQHHVLERRTVARRGGGQRLARIRHVLLEEAAEAREHVLRTARVFGHHDDVERRAVLYQQAARPIVDQPARRVHALETDAVVLRECAVVVALVDLQMPEPSDQEREGADDQNHRDAEAARESRRSFALARQPIVHHADLVEPT